MKFKPLLVAALFYAFLPPVCGAADWPRVAPILKDGRPVTPNVACRDALALARIAYFGSSFIPDVPADNPVGAASELLLMPEPHLVPPNEGDGATLRTMVPLAGGAKHIINEHFEQAVVDEYTAAYVYKPPVAGKRLAIGFVWTADDPHYVSYLLPGTSSADEVLKLLETVISYSPNAPAPVTHSILPPRLYRERVSGQLWLLAREDGIAANDRYLAPWQVLTVGADGLKATCTIEFRTPGRNLPDVLPAPVRQLARQLDATMGSGKDEGTLQTTARLRIEAHYAWINIALRPWVSADPYNSRAIVDRELALWGRRGPSYQLAEANIRKQLVIAEAALADYYRRSFGLTAALAKRLAAYQIDFGFRSHFMFHEPAGTYDTTPVANPWPAGINDRRKYSPQRSAK